MTKQEKSTLILTSLICLFPILIGCILYDELPSQIAIHFDVNNQPDHYVSKNIFVFGFPCMMVILQNIAYLRAIQKDTYKEANKKFNRFAGMIIPFISIVMYLVTVFYALECDIDIRKIVMLILGFLFIGMGNYLPKTKKANMTNIGLSSHLDEKTYKKFARISGYTLIIDGLLFILSIFFEVVSSIVIVVVVILESILLTLYTLKKGKHDEE